MVNPPLETTMKLFALMVLTLAAPALAADPTVESEQIIDLMLELNRKNHVTFLFSTHDPRVVKHAQRALHIQDGRLVTGAGVGHAA